MNGIYMYNIGVHNDRTKTNKQKRNKEMSVGKYNWMIELENHHCGTSNIKYNSANKMFAKSVVWKDVGCKHIYIHKVSILE